METSSLISILSTIISALIAAIISIVISRNANKQSNLKSLNDQLDNILKIAIEYPYLEDKVFRDSWNPNLVNEERYLRYDLYCNLVFNYLERISKFYNYNSKRIEKYLAMKEWIRDHSKCWLNPSKEYENVECYEKEFRELINQYLK